MSFGRSSADVPEELAKKRLQGLVRRAMLKERGGTGEHQESENNFLPECAARLSSSTPEGCDVSNGNKPRHEWPPKKDAKLAKPNRNSLLLTSKQNRWKRSAENDTPIVPPPKKFKEESSDDSSSGEEQPFKRLGTIKKERKNSPIKNSETVELSAEESTQSSSSETEASSISPAKSPQQDATAEKTGPEDQNLEDEPDEIFFKPLGAETRVKKKSGILAGLPLWVKQAVPVPAKVEPCGDLDQDVDVLGKTLVGFLRDDGITGLFPMQRQVIRELLDPRYVLMGLPPRDICVAAPTGSGKTLAYVLPLVKLLKGFFEKAIRAVILLPTSELAKQVYDVFTHYAEPFRISAALLTGLRSHSEEVKMLLERGHPIVDVVIATPKTFLKHLRLTPGFSLKLVSHLVLDEADRMVDMVIHGLIREIEDAIYEKNDTTRCHCSEIRDPGRSRPSAISCCTMDAHSLPLRKLLYSATLMSDPEKLRHVNLFYPRVFHARADNDSQANKTFALPVSLEEYKLFCDINIRPLLVWWLSVHNKMGRMIVFTRTREECHRLRVVIEYMGKCRIVDLSAEMKKRQRQSALTDFENGLYDVLVCTSVLARGMDLRNVEHVILYHVPTSAEDYVHMVGRTARANKPGKALVLLHSGENVKLLKTLKPIFNSKPKELPWEQDSLREFYQRYETALDSAKKAILPKLKNTWS